MMYGPSILVRTLSATARPDKYGNSWQYLSRSDHHSKVACWGVLFDLLLACAPLRRHVENQKVWFGINHEMRDFVQDRKKNLDLVLCTSPGPKNDASTFVDLVSNYEISLSPGERAKLDGLPPLRAGAVSSVLLALEAKACMTAHQRALPRLYDELNSSHATVHGATDEAIAAGFVMINASTLYLSPDLNKRNRATAPEWSTHVQPRDAQLAIDKVRQLPRRSKTGSFGYDALAIVVDCKNDGSPVLLTEKAPAPAVTDIHNYGSMIDRLASIFSTRFKDL